MSNEWDEYAQDWNTDKSVQDYAKKVFDELNLVRSPKNLRILDFGCGTGSLSELLNPEAKNIVAIDSSSKMIELLNEKSLDNVRTITNVLNEVLIQNDPKLNKKFDLIVASSVCSFLPNYEETLFLLKSLLNKDGIFMQWDWLAKDENQDTGLTKKRVQEALSGADFKDIDITVPFIMNSSKGSMSVVMGLGKN